MLVFKVCPTRTIEDKRPHRLAWPRTPPFHGGNVGSNPTGDATFQGSHPSTTRFRACGAACIASKLRSMTERASRW